jgi:hypothetical protein
MKYLISYRQQLKITPARRRLLLLALHSSPASSSSDAVLHAPARKVSQRRVFVPHKKRLFPGKRITLRAQTYCRPGSRQICCWLFV